MKPLCPKCHDEFPPDQVNAGTDTAYCPRCGEAFHLSDLIESGEVDEGDLGVPPRGAWFHAGIDEWEVGATTRSPVAFFLVPFMCAWSGLSLGGIYGSQIIKGQFNPLVSLFGLPFLIGTIFLGSTAAMAVCGKVRVRVRLDEAEVFAGVGAIGWRRRLAWPDISKITEGRSQINDSGRRSTGICLQGNGHVVKFATGVSEERRDFMMAVLRRMLARATSAGFCISAP